MTLQLKKLAQYSAASSAFLVMGQHSDAQVVYNDIDPDLEFTSMDYAPFVIDFNDDGIPELEFEFVYSKTSSPTLLAKYSSFWVNNYGSIRNNNTYAPGSGAEVFSTCEKIAGDDDWHPTPVIRLNSFQYHKDLTGSSSSSHHSGGYWFGQTDKFIAFRFRVDGHLHYGWVRLTVDAQPTFAHETHIYIRDYAWEKTVNKNISASVTAANDVSLTDVANAGDASDFKVTFNKANRENAVTAYRIFIYDTDVPNPSPDELFDLLASRYSEIVADGSASYEANLHNAQVLSNSGLPPVYGKYYKCIVLSMFEDGYVCASSPSDSTLFSDVLAIQPAETQQSLQIFYADNTIHISSTYAVPATVQLFDMQGQVCFFCKLNTYTNTLSIANLPSACYVLKLKTMQTCYTAKFVK